MSLIKSSNLIVLKTWLIGGQIDFNGNESEGFHIFYKSDCNEHLKNEDGSFNLELIKKQIEELINEYGDFPSGGDYEDPGYFNYYGDKYKLKIPCEKNLNILSKRILKELTEMKSWE